ncbi:tryptophan-rich sensory protein [Chitinophaga solisilvae]|uniref:tryptophan-rich sensory protein n=1 Tax=Chitinophaga solisilvae TaxID=1233460 RepID=UPI0013713A6B|nr:tryptophan-rich sensory protein [Chitinophaga solisilvae]
MVSHETLHYRNKSVFNAIAFLVMIAVNALAILLPINGRTTGEIAGKYPNLFAPAAITFSIWSLIYLSLLGYIIYQLWLAFSNRHPAVLARLMDQMKEWFLITAVANSLWLFAWHYELIPVTVGIMLILLAALWMIHLNFGIAQPGATRDEKLFIYLPFSLYLGWISIAAIANIAVLIVYAGIGGNTQTQVWWTILLIAAGTFISIMMVWFRNNIVHALVAVWAFYGILIRQRETGILAHQPVIHACVIAIGIIAVAISWHLYRKPRS